MKICLGIPVSSLALGVARIYMRTWYSFFSSLDLYYLGTKTISTSLIINASVYIAPAVLHEQSKR